jgi:orotate phosphoribosyltransferase
MSDSRDAIANELLDLVVEKSYRRGDFTLSSGKKSQHYINGKMVLLEPRGAELFAKWVMAEVRGLSPAPVAVGGLELGAVPVACCVMSHSDGQLRTFIVRKQKKGHGAEQQIEGRLEAGDKVIVVDDVITTGAATQRAIDAVEARGAEVVAVYCLVDRQEDTLPALAERGIRAAMTLSDLIAATS